MYSTHETQLVGSGHGVVFIGVKFPGALAISARPTNVVGDESVWRDPIIICQFIFRLDQLLLLKIFF